MLIRIFVILLALIILLVEGELDSSDGVIQSLSIDKDSTWEEIPTEGMNAISPDQPDETHSYRGGQSDTRSTSAETADAPAVPDLPVPESAAEPQNPNPAAVNSVEEDDGEEESSDSKESSKKKPSSVNLQRRAPQSLAAPSQPGAGNPKVTVRSRASKRRLRTGPRQM
ncbi:uncharacterized protein si:ch211-133n4.6 [Thalassophryne amazonica]|uniref:uncharacterized protein si:ch211-133n4.6 n=1 Tax=Thalassophryne amazonica TaxID=390379 RepID=UPI001470E2FE|nr:uncharacterized protein si:ch211-133n4.6 [Thalassophryne amazonica]